MYFSPVYIYIYVMKLINNHKCEKNEPSTLSLDENALGAYHRGAINSFINHSDFSVFQSCRCVFIRVARNQYRGGNCYRRIG